MQSVPSGTFCVAQTGLFCASHVQLPRTQGPWPGSQGPLIEQFGLPPVPELDDEALSPPVPPPAPPVFDDVLPPPEPPLPPGVASSEHPHTRVSNVKQSATIPSRFTIATSWWFIRTTLEQAGRAGNAMTYIRCRDAEGRPPGEQV
jgi:hypothetical protein